MDRADTPTTIPSVTSALGSATAFVTTSFTTATAASTRTGDRLAFLMDDQVRNGVLTDPSCLELAEHLRRAAPPGFRTRATSLQISSGWVR